ncbi:MAG: hypothetical protein M1824_001846 [Vezdaea acicularis]|nr:MAG: hypothetical protein M1824_001846 [Vezdaea acicularis]
MALGDVLGSDSGLELEHISRAELTSSIPPSPSQVSSDREDEALRALLRARVAAGIQLVPPAPSVPHTGTATGTDPDIGLAIPQSESAKEEKEDSYPFHLFHPSSHGATSAYANANTNTNLHILLSELKDETELNRGSGGFLRGREKEWYFWDDDAAAEEGEEDEDGGGGGERERERKSLRRRGRGWRGEWVEGGTAVSGGQVREGAGGKWVTRALHTHTLPTNIQQHKHPRPRPSKPRRIKLRQRLRAEAEMKAQRQAKREEEEKEKELARVEKRRRLNRGKKVRRRGKGKVGKGEKGRKEGEGEGSGERVAE